MQVSSDAGGLLGPHDMRCRGQAKRRKLKAILTLKTPITVNEVRTFLGMASYYRKFVPAFSSLAEPLTKLTLKEAEFQWGEDQENAFQQLKSAVATCPMLQFPIPGGHFVVTMDASNVGIGASLVQFDKAGGEHSIAFASRALSRAERNLATVEKECLAIVWNLGKRRHYLIGSHFTVLTDHKPL